MSDLCGIERGSKEYKETIKTRMIPREILERFALSEKKGNYKIRELCGEMTYKGEKTMFDYRKWRWLAECPYTIGNKCCDVMKKAPTKMYTKKTGRVGITGQMASESRLRTLHWLKNGCNAFDNKKPISNPMSFWTDQDVLLYIKQHKLKIASVYGEIVEDVSDGVEGQMHMTDLDPAQFGIFDLENPPLKTTGCHRTGCMFCGFGCHLEKPGEGRFLRMKKTHPKQYEYIMRPWDEGGLGYKQVIDWINENGGFEIEY